MKLNALTTLLLWTSSASADFFTAKSRDVGNNIDLGHLLSVADFHAAIDHNGTWEDVTEYETFDEGNGNQQEQSPDPYAPVATGLVRRADYCGETTGITKMVCDNVPSRNWFWGTGGALAIWYAPKAITTWLNNVGAMIQAGRNLRQIYYNNGGHDELKNLDVNETNSIDYHFSLPYLLDHEGKPDYSSMSNRLVARSDTEADVDLKHDYVYSQLDRTIYYKATSLAFSPNAATEEPSATLIQNDTGTRTLQPRARTSDYTINMIISKHSKANTKAKPSCLAKMLKYHLDASSEKGRFSCRPIDNKGSWHATMHLMINHGKNNKGTYGKCCD